MSTAKQLTAAITARDKLRTRLSDAEVAIIERQTAAEQLAVIVGNSIRLASEVESGDALG